MFENKITDIAGESLTRRIIGKCISIEPAYTTAGSNPKPFACILEDREHVVMGQPLPGRISFPFLSVEFYQTSPGSEPEGAFAVFEYAADPG